MRWLNRWNQRGLALSAIYVFALVVQTQTTWRAFFEEPSRSPAHIQENILKLSLNLNEGLEQHSDLYSITAQVKNTVELESITLTWNLPEGANLIDSELTSTVLGSEWIPENSEYQFTIQFKLPGNSTVQEPVVRAAVTSSYDGRPVVNLGHLKLSSKRSSL